MLTQFIRRILGAASFPRFQTPLARIEPQVYQPPVLREKPEVIPAHTPGAEHGISQQRD